MSASVLFQRVGNAAILTLNRAKALNSLDIEMCSLIKQHLNEAKSSAQHCKAIIMKGAGDKAFCAGGDVKAIWEDVMKGGPTLGKGIPGIVMQIECECVWRE